jgi:phosphopantetheinyl transferase
MDHDFLCRTLPYDPSDHGAEKAAGQQVAKEVIALWAKGQGQKELPLSQIYIHHYDSGKPYFSINCNAISKSLPDISISHSHGLAAAALSCGGGTIGLDVENLSKLRRGTWVRKAFSSEEKDFFQNPAPHAALRLWCAKEAAAKACGTGLQGAPQKWQVTALSPDHTQVTIRHDKEIFTVQLWIKNDFLMAACLRK